jgi:hypothetical protein
MTDELLFERVRLSKYPDAGKKSKHPWLSRHVNVRFITQMGLREDGNYRIWIKESGMWFIHVDDINKIVKHFLSKPNITKSGVMPFTTIRATVEMNEKGFEVIYDND